VKALLIPPIPDLKNTTDDALPNYLSSLKFKQSHYYTDVRLVLGYVAVIIGGALFYFDWTLGWDKTKAYTLPAVVVYFILNGAFTYWIYFVEKGAIFTGEREGVKVFTCSSQVAYLRIGADSASRLSYLQTRKNTRQFTT
jgi:hypothetical protein